MITAKQKEDWIAALRSGNYVQTTGCMYDGGGYCCLGVLAHINGMLVPVPPGMHLVTVSAWAEAGVYTDEGFNTQVPGLLGAKMEGRLADLNDQGVNFKEIALIIEKYVETRG